MTVQEHPLAGYSALMAVFCTAYGSALAAAHRRGRGIPERPAAVDLALGALATYKATRLLSKDRVTMPLRAPFTEYQEDSGHGEVEESPRGQGLRRAMGELLVCPYCLAPWVAAAITTGTVVSPRVTRVATGMLSMVALSDALQLGWSAAHERTT